MRFLLLCITFLGTVTACTAGNAGRATASQAGNTWSIVAVDMATGDVGLAAASCVEVPIDALAALVPGKGVAAVQADFAIENRDRVFALLQGGENASSIIAAVTAPDVDRGAGRRQYGVITLAGKRADVATFTGSATLPWAGARSDPDMGVTVQGNLLAAEAVVADSLEVFRANAALPLPDRLVLALEAGSAAGGDRRCNEGDVTQTATAAFLMVARAGDPAYAVTPFGSSRAGEANTPWLYLSITEPPGGANPLIALRDQYNAWRQDHLPPCGDCTVPQVALPGSAEGARALPPTDLILLGAAVLTTVMMLIVLWRGRKSGAR